MRSIQTFLIAFLCLSSLSVFAQEEFVIEGVVSDATSGATLPFANVFVANTTYGTATDKDGVFKLVLPSSGSYDLVISFMGYETFARVVRFVVPSVVNIDAKLTTKSRQLRGVTVTATKDAQWKRNLEQFKNGFLGRSKFGRSSRIVNEEVLNFDFDSGTGVFEAYAYEPLIIENKKLGYRLKYLLEQYEVHTRAGYSSFYGFTSFEDLGIDRRGNETKKYDKAREEAYLGSQQHFFSTLFAGDTRKQGYEIYHAQDMRGMGRVIDKNQLKVKDIVLKGDTEQSKKLRFEDMMYIYYKGEKTPYEYYHSRGGGITVSSRSTSPTQNSWISMREGEEYIVFEQNGYVRNPLSFYSYGYWSFEKVGDMMPINYQLKGDPNSKRRKRKRIPLE